MSSVTEGNARPIHGDNVWSPLATLYQFKTDLFRLDSVTGLHALYLGTVLRVLEQSCHPVTVDMPSEPNLGSGLGTAAAIVEQKGDDSVSNVVAISITQHGASVPMLEITLTGVSELPLQTLHCLELLTDHASLFAQSLQQTKLIANIELTDPLTNTPNRRAFQAELRHRCDSLSRFALLLVNLNRFSLVNDAMGPEAGDNLLIRLVNRLSEQLSASDYLARINGDEFAILVHDADSDRAQQLAAKIHDAVREPFQVEDRALKCFVSIGATLCPATSLRPTELLRGARIAMADARRHQLGTHIYAGDVSHDHVERLLIESHLDDAIEQDLFTLVAQPIFTVENGRLCELEILLRWTIPGHGPIPPDLFVSVAENIGLSEKLDRYVLAKALRATRGLDIPIAVNLAAPTLYSATFVSYVEALLEQNDRHPRLLGVEITERIIAQPDAARASIDALGRIGVHISIDDFGVGYSSLGVLPEIPISRLKIDKKFLIGKDQNLRYEEVIIGILRMASALGVESLVEGVEDPHIMDWLAQIGCDYAQGFGLARPQPLEQLIESIRHSPVNTRA